ncbi:Nuclear pore complex protein Nup43, partial [Fasciola gigantica]
HFRTFEPLPDPFIYFTSVLLTFLISCVAILPPIMLSNAVGSHVKCISFKLSRVRFASEPDVATKELVVTGSWMEEVNRLCLWRYDCGELIDSGRLQAHSEAEYDLSAGVLGDSADDPRLMDSLIHLGSVQDLKVHPSTQRIYSASSSGSLQVFSTDTVDSIRLRRISASGWIPFPQPALPGNLPVSLASLALSADGDQVYFADDLGRLASAHVSRIPSAVDSSDGDFDFVQSTTPVDRSALVETGADVASVNALERVDNSCLVSANQLGQLKVWDLRCGLQKPQQRLLRYVYSHLS